MAGGMAKAISISRRRQLWRGLALISISELLA